MSEKRERTRQLEGIEILKVAEDVGEDFVLLFGEGSNLEYLEMGLDELQGFLEEDRRQIAKT